MGGGATFNVSSNAHFNGGIVFNVDPLATVYLTGGSYGGTLSGSGGGTVQLSGSVYPAVGGITLNFPGNMFQWTGGAMFASLGNVINQGTLNLDQFQ